MHAASEGAQHAAASPVPTAAARAASSEAQAGSAASRPAAPTAISSCPVDTQTAGSRMGEHVPGPSTMAQGLAMSMQRQALPGSAAAGALLPASAAPGEKLHDDGTERTPGASTLADLGSLQHCPPAQCAEGTDERERSKERRQSLLSNVPRGSRTSNVAQASELHSAIGQQQSLLQRVKTKQHHLEHEDQQVLSHGEAGVSPEHASGVSAPGRVVSGVEHSIGGGPQETAVGCASSAWPAQHAAPQPDGDSRQAREGDQSDYSHLSQEVRISSTASPSSEDLHPAQLCCTGWSCLSLHFAEVRMCLHII